MAATRIFSSADSPPPFSSFTAFTISAMLVRGLQLVASVVSTLASSQVASVRARHEAYGTDTGPVVGKVSSTLSH